MEVNRKDIKHNFLRRIILRLDYNGVVDVKDTLKELEKILPKYEFIEMNTSFVNEAEFELDDPAMIESQLSIPVKELHKIETFKYRTKSKSTVLEINKLFTSLTINTEEYYTFEKYCNIFVDVLELIYKDNIYLNPTRLGIRKINDCIIKNKNNFEQYFNPVYFSDISKYLSESGFKSEKINTEFIDTIIHEDLLFNFVRMAASGVLTINGSDFDVYQVAIDIDGYTNDSSKLSYLMKDSSIFKSEVNKINEYLFKLYIRVLSDKFISELKADKFESDDILGVSKNDRV